MPFYASKVGPHRSEPAAKTPAWVKASFILAIVFAVAFAVLHLAGRSPHAHSERRSAPLSVEDRPSASP